MMSHLTDEAMMELVYGEAEDAAALERHLDACGQCEEAYSVLRSDLAGVDRVEAPARDDGYGDRVWAAIAPALPEYRPAFEPAYRPAHRQNVKQSLWRLHGLWKGLGYAAACALLITGAFYAGRQWEHRKQPPALVAKQAPEPKAKQPIVVVLLDDHLDRSERFLVQLKHADVDSTALVSPMREEAKSLLAANRVCRKNLAESKDPELSSALDHLDRLLAEAANEPGGLNARNIAALQDEMNADGLLFEVRVLRSRITHRKGGAAGTGNNPAKGATI
jgi:hypothetical protein